MKKTLDTAILIFIAIILLALCIDVLFKQDELFLQTEKICNKQGGVLIDSSNGFYCFNVK